jgi:hypothetical protein
MVPYLRLMPYHEFLEAVSILIFAAASILIYLNCVTGGMHLQSNMGFLMNL